MKKRWIALLAACMVALACSGCGNGGESDPNSSSSLASNTPATVEPSPSPAPQTAKALRVTANAGLNIRSEASTDSQILGLAENGSRLALMVEDEKDGWYQIQYEGQVAYVSAEYVEVIEVNLDEYNQLRGGAENTNSGSEDSSASSASTAPDSSSSTSSGESSSSANSTDSEDGE